MGKRLKELLNQYSSMSDEEKGQNLEGIKSLIKDREDKIWTRFGKFLPTMAEAQEFLDFEFTSRSFYKQQEPQDDIYMGDLIVGQAWFGIKDELNPIEDYISEIQDSNGYKNLETVYEAMKKTAPFKSWTNRYQQTTIVALASKLNERDITPKEDEIREIINKLDDIFPFDGIDEVLDGKPSASEEECEEVEAGVSP